MPCSTRQVASLSDVLRTELRVENAFSCLIAMGDDGSIAFAPRAQPCIYAVLEGTVPIAVAGHPTQQLNEGDCALIFYGDSHRLGTARSVNFAAQDAIERIRPRDTVHAIEVGGGGNASVLRTALELSFLPRAAFAHRAAPALAILRAPDTALSGELVCFGFAPRQLSDALQLAGGDAVASAFATLQFGFALRALTLDLWDDAAHDIRNANARRIAAIVREVRAHPNRAWTVSQLAKTAGLSRSAFADAFQTVTGTTPMAFVTRERMTLAERLLRTESLTCDEVGKRVGYAVRSSFTRAFQRHTGLAPRAYQRGAPETDRA